MGFALIVFVPVYCFMSTFFFVSISKSVFIVIFVCLNIFTLSKNKSRPKV